MNDNQDTTRNRGTSKGEAGDKHQNCERRHHRGFGAVTLLLVGGLAGAGVVTALGVAANAGAGFNGEADGMMMGGGHGHRQHGQRGGERGERMKERVAWVLGSVDATPEQRDRVQSALEDVRVQMRDLRAEGGELRRQLVTELAGADIDRAELERIRGDFVAGMEERSKMMVDGLAGAAETLTPEQRVSIAQFMASRGPRR